MTEVRNFHRRRRRRRVHLLWPLFRPCRTLGGRRVDAWDPPPLPSGNPSTRTRRHRERPDSCPTAGGSSNKRVNVSTKNRLTGELAAKDGSSAGSFARFGDTRYSELPLQSIYIGGGAVRGFIYSMSCRLTVDALVEQQMETPTAITVCTKQLQSTPRLRCLHSSVHSLRN